MSQDRSGPLPLPLGVFVALSGVGAMMLTGALLARSLGAVGLRGLLVLSGIALLVPAALALAVFRPHAWPNALGLAHPGRRTLLVSAGLAVTLWGASLGLLELQYAVWPPEPGYLEGFRRLHEMLRPHGPLDAVLSLGAIAIAPALSEEALVRGVLLPSLRVRLAAPWAIGLSSALFAFMHDAYRMPFTFAVGLALGALRLRTGSLWPPVVAHACLNALTFAAAPFVDDPTKALPEARPLLGLLLLGAGAAGTAFLWTRLPKTVDPRSPTS